MEGEAGPEGDVEVSSGGLGNLDDLLTMVGDDIRVELLELVLVVAVATHVVLRVSGDVGFRGEDEFHFHYYYELQ